MKRIMAVALTPILFASMAYAHNGQQHVMGMVTAMSETSVTVKAMDGTTQTIAVTPDTKYMKQNAAIQMKEIKVGDHVVIHAAKSGDQMTATEVKVGMSGMKGMKGMGDMKEMGNMKGMSDSGTQQPK